MTQLQAGLEAMAGLRDRGIGFADMEKMSAGEL